MALVLLINSFDAAHLNQEDRASLLAHGIEVREVDPAGIPTGTALLTDKDQLDALVRAEVAKMMGRAA